MASHSESAGDADHDDGFDFTELASVCSTSCTTHSLASQVQGQRVQEAAADTKSWKKSGSSARTTSTGTVGKKTCPLCDAITAGTSRFCGLHKRAYESIYRQATKDAGSTMCADFVAIFGDKRAATFAQPSVAYKVILDFCELNPDGKGAAGRKRPLQDLAQYVHSQGAREEEQHRVVCMKWDFELFCTEMASRRGWSVAQCRTKWDELEADPSTGRDMLGPGTSGGGSSLRLHIPGSLTGADSVELVRSRFEEKRLDRFAKAARMGDEVASKIQAECEKGFKRAGSKHFDAEAMSTPNKKGALTGEDGPQGVGGLMREHLGRGGDGVNTETPDTKGAGNSTAASPLALVVPGGREEALPAAPPVDVEHARNVLQRTVAAQVKTEEEKVKKAIDKGASALCAADTVRDTDLVETLDNRLSVAVAWLHKEVYVNGDGEVQLRSLSEGLAPQRTIRAVCNKATEGSDEQESQRKKDYAEYVEMGRPASHFVRAALLRLAFRPVEAPKAMQDIAELNALLDHIKQAAKPEALEEARDQWRQQKTLLGQLLASLRTATNDLASASRRRQTEDARVQQELQKKKAEEAKKKKATEQVQAERALQERGHQNVGFLVLPWADWGHKPVPVAGIADVESIRELDFTKPFIVPASDGVLKQCLEVQQSDPQRLVEVLRRFATKFPVCEQAVREGAAQARCPPAVIKELFTAFSTLRGECDAVTQITPKSMMDALNTPMLYGMTKSYLQSGMDMQCLGQLRLQAHGELGVLMARATSFVHTSGGQPPQTMNDWLQALKNVKGEADGKTMLANGLSLHCTLQSPNSVLWTPPGWLTCEAALNSADCSGVKIFLLPRACVAQLSDDIASVKKLCAEQPAVIKHLDAVLDGLAVAHSVKAAVP